MDQASFEGHPLWQSMQTFDELLGQAEDDAESSASRYLDQLRYLDAALRSHREPPDTGPYSNAALTNVHGLLSNNIMPELTAYVANRNVAHLTNAEPHGDNVLNLLGSWPSAALRGGAAAQANRLFVEYRDLAENTIANLREEIEEAAREHAERHANAEQSMSALQSAVSELQAKITQDEARLDSALTTNNDAFTAKQTEREEKFNAWLEEQGSTLEELARPHLDELAASRDRGKEAYDAIDGLRVGTEKVAGLATADILAGKFREYSRQQWGWGISANILGFGALVVGVFVIAGVLQSIGADDRVSWQYTTLRLGVTLTIVGFAAVAFRLGSQFLSRSHSAKRLELELTAIGPFFADIEDSQALTDAKIDFISRSFGRAWEQQNGSDRRASSEESISLVKELRELIKVMRKNGE